MRNRHVQCIVETYEMSTYTLIIRIARVQHVFVHLHS